MGGASTPSTLNDGIVHWWDFEETSGARSSSVGDFDLSPLTNNPGSATGVSGNAASFDGTQDLVSATSPSSFCGGGSAWSMSAWIFHDAGFKSFPISNWDALAERKTWSIYKEDDDEIRMYTDHAVFTTLSGKTWPEDEWCNLVLTYDGVDQFSIYINAELQGTITDTLDTDNDGRLYLGRTVGRTDHHRGEIDSLGFWNRVLTAAEIAELYNNPGKAYPF